jgi:hypothetical protein
MLVSAAIFIPHELRTGLHPQLDRRAERLAPFWPWPRPRATTPWAKPSSPRPPRDAENRPRAEAPPRLAAKPGRGGARAGPGRRGPARTKEKSPSLDFRPPGPDPDRPGLPDWSFHTLRLSFDGPVSRDQAIRLWLVPPWAKPGPGLHPVRLLLAALFLGQKRQARPGCRPASAGHGPGRPWPPSRGGPARMLHGRPGRGRTLPAPRTPKTIQGPAHRARPVLPLLPGQSRGGRRHPRRRLRIEVALDALTRSPRPCRASRTAGGRFRSRWTTAPAMGLVRNDGAPHVLVSRGTHRVVLTGPLPDADSFAVDWPLVPRTLAVAAPGYQVRGLSADGNPERAVRLDRLEKPEAQETGPSRPKPRPAASRLSLGLADPGVGPKMERRDRGRAPEPDRGGGGGGDTPCARESVLGETVKATGGKALVTLEPGQERLTWRSRLDIRPETVLAAPEDAPGWNLDHRGRAHLGGRGHGRPALRKLRRLGPAPSGVPPWPGERLTLGVTRPEAAPGRP